MTETNLVKIRRMSNQKLWVVHSLKFSVTSLITFLNLDSIKLNVQDRLNGWELKLNVSGYFIKDP